MTTKDHDRKPEVRREPQTMAKACFALFLLISSGFAQSDARQNESRPSRAVASVKAVRQSAFVERPSTSPPVQRGRSISVQPALRLTAVEKMQIAEGDVVQTSAGGGVQIVLTNGSMIALGPQARLIMQAFDEPRDTLVVELVVGKLHGAASSSATSIEIRTANSVVAPEAGSEFIVDTSVPIETVVVCSSGKVKVGSRQEGEPVVLSQRQAVTMSDGGATIQPATAAQLETAETPAGTGTPSAEAPTDVYRPGPGVTLPKLIYKVDPEYPDNPREIREVQGEILLEALVDAKGSVRSIRVLRGIHRALDEKAIETVKQWKFKPGLKNGKPVAVQVQIEVSFHSLK